MNACHLGDEGLGFALGLHTLKEVLENLNVKGRRWWIACDPDDAVVTEFVTVGHGDPQCKNRLNTIYFQVPVINASSAVRPDQLILCFSSGAIWCQDAGFYREGAHIVTDMLEDFNAFFYPIRNALLERMQSDDGNTPA